MVVGTQQKSTSGYPHFHAEYTSVLGQTAHSHSTYNSMEFNIQKEEEGESTQNNTLGLPLKLKARGLN